MMDTSERSRLRALCEAATPGPWETYRPAAGGLGIAHGDPRTHHGCIARIVAGSPADAALMGIARTALPALLDAMDAAEARATAAERERDEARAEVERLRHRLDRVIVAADQIPQHLGATWWGQQLRAALVTPATEVPDDHARGAGGAS